MSTELKPIFSKIMIRVANLDAGSDEEIEISFRGYILAVDLWGTQWTKGKPVDAVKKVFRNADAK